MVGEIKTILMERDGMTAKEADMVIREAKKALKGYLADGDNESAENICEEFFDLEPDYIFELL